MGEVSRLGRPPGSTNKRSRALARELEEDFNLNAIHELARLVTTKVMLTDADGNTQEGPDGTPVFVPYLKPGDQIQALRIIADKTYPSLKSVAAQVSNLPLAVVDMMGVRDLDNDGEVINGQAMDPKDLGIGLEVVPESDPSQDEVARVLGMEL